MSCPKLVHKQALKQIGHYLKTTANKGLIMKPSEKLLKIDSFPDAIFAGIYGHKAMDDPVCVISRTGYLIMVANCPIMWQSKLQSETTLSTMEAEVIAIAHSNCKLFPNIDGISIMGKAIGLPVGNTTIQVLIHEDNAGALVLAKTYCLNSLLKASIIIQRLVGFKRRL